MTAYTAPIPIPDPATAQALLARLNGTGCTSAYIADKIGCGRLAAAAWARSVGACRVTYQHLSIWAIPTPERARKAVLNQDRAGKSACSSLDWAGGNRGGEGS